MAAANLKVREVPYVQVPEPTRFEWATREEEVAIKPFSEEDVAKALEFEGVKAQVGDGMYPEAMKDLCIVELELLPEGTVLSGMEGSVRG